MKRKSRKILKNPEKEQNDWKNMRTIKCQQFLFDNILEISSEQEKFIENSGKLFK